MTQADDFPKTPVVVVSISSFDNPGETAASLANRGFPFRVNLESRRTAPFGGSTGMLYAALGTYLVDKFQNVLSEMDIEEVVRHYYNSVLDRGTDADENSVEALKEALAGFKKTYRDIPTRKFIIAMSRCMSFLKRFPDDRDFAFDRIVSEFYPTPDGNLDLWKYSRIDNDFKAWCELHDYWFPPGKCVYYGRRDDPAQPTTNQQQQHQHPKGETHDEEKDHQGPRGQEG